MGDPAETAPAIDLWIASRNVKKRKELERLLGGLGLRIHTLDELDEAVGVPVPDLPENAPDFAGNAYSKAHGLMQALHGAVAAGALPEPTGPTLALGDDSGLCVDALGGDPGVRSARWAGPSDADRNDALLEALRERGAIDPSDRAAQFACSLCVVDWSGQIHTSVEERCHGTLRLEVRGGAGFGYDPLFVPDEHPPGEPSTGERRSFAELAPEEKDAVSHRGKALRALAKALNSGN